MNQGQATSGRNFRPKVVAIVLLWRTDASGDDGCPELRLSGRRSLKCSPYIFLQKNLLPPRLPLEQHAFCLEMNSQTDIRLAS